MRPIVSRIVAAVVGAIVLFGGGAALAVALTPTDRSTVVERVEPIVVQPVPSPDGGAPAPDPGPVAPQPPVDVEDDDDDDDDLDDDDLDDDDLDDD